MALLVQLPTLPDLGGDLHNLFRKLLGISLLRISCRSIYHRFTARVSSLLQHFPLYTIIINYWYLSIRTLKYFRPLYHEYGIDVDDIDLVAIMYFVRALSYFWLKDIYQDTTPNGLVPLWENLAVCIDMIFLVAIVLTIIIFFCIKIQTALRNNIVMSAKTKRLQVQLFKALFYQVGNLHKNIKRKDS